MTIRMDNMEDSGFDSDNKSNHPDPKNGLIDESAPASNGTAVKSSSNTYKKSTQLQKKIDKHRELASKKAITSQPKKSTILSRNRLTVPQKTAFSSHDQDNQPLVAIMSDDSDDDDFDSPMLSKAAQKEITQQLIKDGYNLDLEPDDEDLDLIPPRPMNERCTCCNTYVATCVIQ